MINRRQLTTSLSALALGGFAGSKMAQAQTNGKLARMVVGFSPGGATDTIARILVEKMHAQYPNGLIVDSRPGASSRLAMENVKASAPDGSTMMFTVDFTMTIFPHSFRKLSYDPLKDFTPVALCCKSAVALSVGPEVPDSVKTVAQFVEWCKANPKRAAYASTSAGATPHFAGLMFSKAAGVDMLHVPYKGGAPALQDLMGGQIASSFNPIGEVLPYVGTNKLRVLATTGRERSRFLPDAPTLVELGYKDVVAEAWLGVIMPANVPAPIVDAAAKSINDALGMPDVRQAYAKVGMDIVQGTSASFAALIKSDLATWGPIIKASGFTADE